MTTAPRATPVQLRSSATAPHVAPEPYRLLFPLGILAAVAGSVVWPATWLGVLGYPGVLHRELMIPGFEQCFVSGFLLTAMPAFTHGPRCSRLELGLAVAAALATLTAALLGSPPAVAGTQLASVLLLVTALARRVARSRQLPPEEFAFVAFGLAAGLLGLCLQLAGAFNAAPSLPARFPERLVSLGMVLSLVVGLGSLLVPTFAGMPRPLALPGIAGPHERHGRRPFYLAIVAVLALSFLTDAIAIARVGPLLRAAAVSTMMVVGWKLTRRPGHRTLHAHALWLSGWAILVGLWLTALLPALELAGLHIVFIGGFALLTLAIATRVTVAHGSHPLAVEPGVLSPAIVALLGITLACRLAAEADPQRRALWLAVGGTFAGVMWLWWGTRVVRLLTRKR